MDLRAHGLVPLDEIQADLARAARGIPLHGPKGIIRAFAVVDACDYKLLAACRWHLTTTGYARRFEGGRPPKRRSVRMHRVVAGIGNDDPRHTDHINGDRLDNRRANLRVVLEAGNHQNQPATRKNSRTSQHRGVSFNTRTQRWVAQGRCGSDYFCKHFDTEQEAAQAAAAWRRQHMPFAVN